MFAQQLTADYYFLLFITIVFLSFVEIDGNQRIPFCSPTVPIQRSFTSFQQERQFRNETKIVNFFETFLSLQMEEKSTICLTNENTSSISNDDDRLTISVQLASHEIDYPIGDHYSFNLPDIQTPCYCQCNSELSCHFENCDKLCFNKTVFGGNCKNTFSKMCCSTHIVPSVRHFRAFRVAPPRHVLTFKLRQFVSDFRPFSETNFRVTDSSGVNVRSEKVDIHLRANFNFQSFEGEHELSSNDWILTSSDFAEAFYRVDANYINDLIERNPAKLGWFRPSLSGNEIPSKFVLSRLLDVSATNCEEENYEVNFHGMTSKSDLQHILRPIKNDGNFDFDFSRRVVRIKPKLGTGNNNSNKRF